MKTFKEYIEEIYSKSSAHVFINSPTEDGGTETGADVSNAKNKIIKDIPLSKVHPNEPSAWKVKQPSSIKKYKGLVNTIKTGKRGNIPGISVIPHPDKKGHFLVADGHHRYQAHKIAGARTIKAEIIDPKKTEIHR